MDQRGLSRTQRGQLAFAGLIIIAQAAPRFNRLAWGHVDASRPHGIIAAGLENGELALWDPSKIISGAGYVYSKLLQYNAHTPTQRRVPNLEEYDPYGPCSQSRL